MPPTDRGNSEYRFEQVAPASTAAEAHLLAEVFSDSVRYTPEYLRWQYYENPDGDVVGFNAFHNNELAAHYVVQPLRATIAGEILPGVLSLNTATGHQHQGRGLFVKLASMTYELAAQRGYRFVEGVANANSTPGFVRKLNFQLVSPLDAYIGAGYPAPLDTEASFARQWSDDALRWRLRRPGQDYWSSGERIYAPSGKPAIAACIASGAQWRGAPVAPRRSFSPACVWLGLRPRLRWCGIRFPVPAQLRPSPLNLIFLPLDARTAPLTRDAVSFEAIDFDAY